MKGAKVLVQPLTDILGSFGKHLKDVGVVCVVV